MSITTRPASAGDLAAVATIMYAAFRSISDHHRFPPDFDSPETAHGVASLLLNHPKFYGVIAEDEGRILGSNFINSRLPIVGLGPISVDPRGAELGRSSIDGGRNGRGGATTVCRHCLVQLAYHNRSLCLYTTLGFRSRVPLANAKKINIGDLGDMDELPSQFKGATK